MKKIWLIGLACAAIVLPSGVFAQVETSIGTLNIGGKIKWNYAYQMESGRAKGASNLFQRWGLDGAGVETFTTSNVELDISGTVGENVSYLIELAATPFAGGMGGFSNPGELAGSAVGVRQAKIMVHDLIPMTVVTLGTFNLPVGNYQDRATNDWDMIALPLMNMAFWGPWVNGGIYAPIGLGWQATGVNFEIKPVDMVALDVSYFNGNAGGAPNVDIDLEKSWLIGLKLMPTEGALLGVSWLSETWQEDLNNPFDTSTEQQRASGWVVNAAYQTDQFELTADWLTMTADEYTLNKRGRATDLNWMAWQVTAGVWVTDSIEILARYDWADPDTSNSKRPNNNINDPVAFTKINKYDALTVWTLGTNIRLSENAEVSANYLWIVEQGSLIHNSQKPAGTRYQAGMQQGRRQRLDNNMLMIQVQVWQ